MNPPPPVTLELLQWLLGGAGILLVAVGGWIARRLDRIEARERERERSHQQDADKTQERVENDFRDLWQALDAHRQEVRQTAREAASARERVIDRLHAIELQLSRFAVREPDPCPPPPSASA